MSPKRKILLFILGIVLGIIPTIPFLIISHRNSAYVGNLSKYEKLNIDFQEEFKDNCLYNNRELQIDGYTIAEINIEDNWANEKATNYNVRNIMLYEQINDTLKLRHTNTTMSFELYHDSCYFYLKTDTL